MPGFLISNMPQKSELHNYGTNCCQAEIEDDNCWARWNTLNKFLNDKLFFQTERYIVIFEGVLLNKKELCLKYKDTLDKTIIEMYEQLGCSFMKELRGSFSGALYDKLQKQLLLYVDQISTKPLYYFWDENGYFACGTQLNYVTDLMKENSVSRIPDEHGLSCILLYGNFMDESTGVSDVKRLFPGDCLILCGDKLETRTYYQISPAKQKTLSHEEYIDLLDVSFRNAVKRLLDKDKEYGYKSIIDISGGVDSRMIGYTAKSLGYENAIAISYSQSGGRENRIAQEVANCLGYDFYYKSLDNGTCLYSVDDNVLMNNGSAIYIGITGGKDFLQTINSSDFGLELTGLLGDIYDGSMVVIDGEEKPYLEYPKFLFGSVLPYDEQTYSNVLNRFDNMELFWYYIRGMICGMSSFPIRQNFVEPMTPFGDVEFMEAYLSIPWDVRVKEKLLYRWMVEKYPEAAGIPYAATGITPAEEFTFVGRCKKILKFANQEIHRQLHCMQKEYLMNPFEHWCKQKPEVMQFVQQYYLDNIQRTDGMIRDKLVLLMKDGTPFLDKALALTVLSYYKQFLD